MRNTVTAALALLLTLPLFLPAAAGAGDDAEKRRKKAAKKAAKHFRSGEKARDKRDFDKAEREYASALELDPSHAKALYGLGQVQMATKRYPEALDTLLRCKQAYADNAQRDAERAEMDRMAEIRVTRDKIRTLLSGSQKGGGTAHTEIDLLQQRLLALEQPLDDPDEHVTPAGVSMAIGSAYFRMGNGAEAEREFLAAVTADPSLGEAHNNLAALYFMAGQLEPASRHLERAEATGFKVHPQLKADIAAARAKASP